MATFYRVHAWLPTALPGESGHPLYVHPGRADGRIDNPNEYESFYVADTAAGAIAETFASHQEWTPALLDGPPYLAGSVRAITTFTGDPSIKNLNDAGELLSLSLRPSRVVTRHRAHTQAWALSLYTTGNVDGVSWWSYHDPDWASIGLWDRSGLTVMQTIPLTEGYAPFVEARTVLRRPWAAA